MQMLRLRYTPRKLGIYPECISCCCEGCDSEYGWRGGRAQMLRLRYTPRRLVIHPEFNTLIVAEADHGTLPWAARGDAHGAANGAAAMDADGAGAQVTHSSWTRVRDSIPNP